MTALDAARRRRSRPLVTAAAPTTDELLPLIEGAASVADHGALRPWRIIELRGDARRRLGDALAAASGATGAGAHKIAAKPLRAELLLAIVECTRPSPKVAPWEQGATAAGIGHLLSLLLDEAGWGVMWRTGLLTRSEEVRRAHGLADNEQLLGWLYVGGIPDEPNEAPKPRIDPREFLSAL
ncbi:nitroreductase family protein [Marisediminicola antarctica]|uniref:Putative NAD(P)H nitroreductase n=1 Tax=Marisediminicola antarctica TaxID=674079 RepID=A0A7L5AGQ4_9MICO|nr:nitroreductase family protein [Marisediminicola antarctica]QHO69186.1 nitroreductase [Marisediminicola antarctica]